MGLPWIPQNPGIDLNQLTDAEILAVESFAALGDPNADRIIFWDDSAGAYAYLTAGTGLSISGTTMTATGTFDGGGTTSQIAYWVDADTLGALTVATYPSLTELAYVKGVTSAIQTQINTKQATITFGTNVLTALGVNIGSAGAPVLLGGVLGTPSSGVATNLTGTAASLTAGLATDTVTKTGTGSTYVTNTTPTIATPNLTGITIHSADANYGGVGYNAAQISIRGASNANQRLALGYSTSDEYGFIQAALEGTGYKSLYLNPAGGVVVIMNNIELGHATDTTIARVSAGVISVEGVTVPTISSTSTFTNKRTTKRVQSVSDAATITPNADSDDNVDITAIAQAFTIANPSGTPTNKQTIVITIKDNGTARAITWGNGYAAGGIALPSTTVLSKILNLGFIYNTANSLNKWQLIASAQEA